MNYKLSLLLTGILAYSLPTDAAIKKPQPKPTAKAKQTTEKHYRDLTTREEYDAAKNSTRPQIIKFYTDTCTACHAMEPIYNEMAAKQGAHADFSAINLDKKEFSDLIKEHSLESVPTTIFLKSGKEVKREVGSMTSDDLNKQVASFVKRK